MGIIASVQQYDLNIPVGGSQAIDVAGDRVQFLSATDPFAVIEVRPNFAQGNITLKPGQGMRFSEQVQRWVVFNKGTVALTGMMLIGTGDFIDQRISGTVDVIDGGKARTLGNVAFAGFTYQGAVAAQCGRVQLWNPAGSGKNVVVEQVLTLAGGVATACHIKLNTAALTTLDQVGQSKKSGGTASVMELRRDSTATPSAAPMLLAAGMPASQLTPYKPVEPVVLIPGYGLLIYGTVVNTDIGASFEWYEDAA